MKVLDGADGLVQTYLSYIVNALNDIREEVLELMVDDDTFLGAIINMSWSFPGSLLKGNQIELVQEMVHSLYDLGVPLVASAANEMASRGDHYPCAFAGVLCTGAIDIDYEMVPTNDGASPVDILAPGEEIDCLDWRTSTAGRFIVRSGAALAAALVTSDLASKIGHESQMFSFEEGIMEQRLFQNAQYNEVQLVPEGHPNVLLNTGIHHPDKNDEDPYRYALGNPPPSMRNAI